MDILFLLLFILLTTLYLIRFPLLKWSYGCGWVLGVTQNLYFFILFSFLLLFSFSILRGGMRRGEEGDIKNEEKKKNIFTPIFNRSGLCVGKAIFFKSRINNVNLSQTTSEFTIITHFLIHHNCKKNKSSTTPQLNKQIKKIHPP